MKACLSLVVFLLMAGFESVVATQNAQVRLCCVSLRFQTGSNPAGSTLDLTTIPPPSIPNGELAPATGQFTHTAGIVLTIDLGAGPQAIPGGLALDVPLGQDQNNNGFDDLDRGFQRHQRKRHP
jgi:hypothetical protein